MSTVQCATDTRTCGTIELTHVSFVRRARNQKTKEKSSYTSRKCQQSPTTARRQDCCKHASHIPLLHYRQRSFCKGKHERNFWTFEALKYWSLTAPTIASRASKNKQTNKKLTNINIRSRQFPKLDGNKKRLSLTAVNAYVKKSGQLEEEEITPVCSTCAYSPVQSRAGGGERESQ